MTFKFLVNIGGVFFNTYFVLYYLLSTTILFI